MARPYKFTVEQLNEKFKGYFDYIKENPFYKYDVVKTGQDAGKELKIRIDQMPSIEGLCWFIGISKQEFFNWLNEGTEQKNKELFDFATHARNQIQQIQIAGGGSGLYQPMIVARLNQLKDVQEVTQTNIDATGKNEDEIRAAIRAIQEARKQKS